jgi:hypothetical protein
MSCNDDRAPPDANLQTVISRKLNQEAARLQ